MKKIIFAADYVYLGGGEIMLLDLMSALRRHGFEPILVIPKMGPLFYEAKGQAIHTMIVDMPPVGKNSIRHPLKFLKAVFDIIGIIKKENVSYVFANNLNAGVYAALAAKPFGITSAWYCWGYYFPKDRFWQYMYRFLFDKIIFCSRFIKKRMGIYTFKEGDLAVLYPGIDTRRMDGDNAYFEDMFKKENRIQEDNLLFSIVGRLETWKNHLMFLDVAAEIIRQHPKSYFIIAGAASEDEGGNGRVKAGLEEKIKKIPSLDGKVMFTGFIRDVKKIIKSSKIVFSCSGYGGIEESFGITVVETMASGRAVIATSVGGPKEIITEGSNGFLVEAGDYKAMAKKALDLINSPSEYIKIINNAKRHALEKYTIERFAKDIAAVYSN